MFWNQHELKFSEWIDFLPLRSKNWVKKGKEKQKNIKIIGFFGTPYVRHLHRDLKTQILTILKINSEFMILMFSGKLFFIEMIKFHGSTDKFSSQKKY